MITSPEDRWKMICDVLKKHKTLNSETIRVLTGLNRHQIYIALNRMVKHKILNKTITVPITYYKLNNKSDSKESILFHCPKCEKFGCNELDLLETHLALHHKMFPEEIQELLWEQDVTYGGGKKP
jgi:hypothetical protein